MSMDSILTCISTGGPPTNVTWTRGTNLVPVSENTPVSVLDNATTVLYTHILIVTGTELSSPYGCTVSNNKPSSAKVIVTIDDNGMIHEEHYSLQQRVNGLCFIISLEAPQV